MEQKLAGLGKVNIISEGKFVIRLPRKEDIPLVARAVVESGGELYRLLPGSDSLEDLFVNLAEGVAPDVDHSRADV